MIVLAAALVGIACAMASLFLWAVVIADDAADDTDDQLAHGDAPHLPDGLFHASEDR